MADKGRRAAIAGVCLTGCGLFLSVRQSDVDAWPGTPADTLRAHPLFSTIPLTVATLSNGRELWTFSNCGTRPVRCVTNAYGTTCAGGDESCCYNQFFVKDEQVEEYRPVGNCYTDCSTRPAGECAPARASQRRMRPTPDVPALASGVPL